jgi:uncharacterized protein YndB with AHSA1/START domain
MTSSGTAKVTLPTDTQILITREFDAPARLVWKAYTTPELIKQWWGGERGTVTIADVDLRVGGRWRYVLAANGGFEVAFHGEYHEIVAPERLVSTEAYEGIPDPDEHAALVTATFTETDGRTLLELLVEHRDQQDRDMHINSGMEAGMQESMDLLERIAAAGDES